GETGSGEKRSIAALYESPKTPGVLWVGTSNGLYKFQYRDKAETLSCFFPNPKNAPANDIRSIFAFPSDPETLWIGTSAGLYRFQTGSKRFESGTSGTPAYGPGVLIRSIHGIEGDPRVLLISSHGDGLDRFEVETGRYRHLHVGNSNLKITSICRSAVEKDVFWVGGVDTGLLKYDVYGKLLASYKKNSSDPAFGISSNDITSIFEDCFGVLWVGTLGGGINKCHGVETFRHYRTSKNPARGLGNGYVHTVFEDYAGTLWIGTNGGLSRLNRNTGIFSHYKAGESGLNGNRVNVVFESIIQPGTLWIGTSGGLNSFDTENRKWRSHGKSAITSIYESPALPGMLWAGSLSGLHTFSTDTGVWKQYNKENLNHRVLTVFEDSEGLLWIGTEAGLFKYHRERDKWTSYRHVPGMVGGISDNKIWALYESPSEPGILWVGTSRGLNRFDSKKGGFSVYGEKQGLPNDLVFGILEEKDADGRVKHLWLSTNNGLSRFDVRKKVFKNFDTRDGLQHNIFTRGACLRNRKGEMFFGGINGLNAFLPANVKDNPYPPRMVVTGFSRFNKKVRIGQEFDGRVILKKTISETDDIVLSYEDTSFSFEFAALHYGIPGKNRHAYKLEGVNKDWVLSGSRRFADYTNLDPGHYVFRVKGTNNDGVPSTVGKSIRITITPPFWMTWWFRFTALFLALGLFWGLHRLRIRKIKKRNEVLEATVDIRTREIREHSVQISRQKEIIEGKNNQIMGSIRYAERIQSAILPDKDRIATLLPDHFVIFRPKDIVSGDFYWINRVEDKVFVAVIDCTGHGVPGAFMSMIGNTLLNDIINDKKIADPAMILEHLNNGIRLALKQETDRSDTHDGMDVCLCVIDVATSEKQLAFTGARRSLFIVRKGSGKPEFQEIKGTRQSIGGRQKSGKKKEFARCDLQLESGDIFYLTTDGFIDQQDDHEVRFGSKRLREFLLKISQKSVAEQKESLLVELGAHQGAEEQRDDITIIGVRM
ncbi:MAG: SpoIIE family protein phosphatase, partial [bacterium]|nr:SpoIIE family protein phosphatase [bacterium]